MHTYKGKSCVFHYNSDFSGEIRVNNISEMITPVGERGDCVICDCTQLFVLINQDGDIVDLVDSEDGTKIQILKSDIQKLHSEKIYNEIIAEVEEMSYEKLLQLNQILYLWKRKEFEDNKKELKFGGN